MNKPVYISIERIKRSKLIAHYRIKSNYVVFHGTGPWNPNTDFISINAIQLGKRFFSFPTEEKQRKQFQLELGINYKESEYCNPLFRVKHLQKSLWLEQWFLEDRNKGAEHRGRKIIDNRYQNTIKGDKFCCSSFILDILE